MSDEQPPSSQTAGPHPRRRPARAAEPTAPTPKGSRYRHEPLSFGNPLWTKAPFLLRRFPGVLVAVLGAVLVLAMASAASPLFLSSAGNASLERQLRQQYCKWNAGFTVSDYGPVYGTQDGLSATELLTRKQALITQGASGISGLGPKVVTIEGSQAQVAAMGGTFNSRYLVQALFRTDALAHVRKLRSVSGPGVWISDVTASNIGVSPGDTIRVRVFPRETTVRVAGIYRDLSFLPVSQFWCSLTYLIYPQGREEVAPPALMLMDRTTMLQVGAALKDYDRFRWEIPVQTRSTTLPEAEDLSARLQAFEAEMDDPTSRFATVLPNATQATQFPDLVQQANDTVTGLTGPIDIVSLAGRVVALFVIGAAGIYAVQRRRVEVALLTAQGISPVELGARSVIETLLPAAAGGAAGWALGVLLVKAIGPTSLLDPRSVRSAAWQVVWATAVAVILLGIVAGAAVRKEAETRTGRLGAAVSRTPWDVVVLALAAASFYEIVTRGTAPVETTSGGLKVDVLPLLFPLLFIAGLSGLATRLLRRALPGLRVTGRRWPSSLYLASRRLASASRMALILITGAALSIGILMYSGILVDSIRATSNAKAQVFTGSDVAVTLPERPVIPRLPFPTTRVMRVTLGVSVLPGDTNVHVLAVDRATFAQTAFWDESFARGSLPSLLDSLAGGQAKLPIVDAAGLPLGASLDVGDHHIALDVIESVKAFPGLVAGQPLIVADRDAFERALTASGASIRDVGFTEQLWAKGDPNRILGQMRRANLQIEDAITADQVKDTPSFLSLSWTFGFLQALGIMSGIIALIGTLLYLQARQRSREVSYALSRRMGLRKRSHRLSVAVELAAMLVLSFAIGAVLAGAASFLIYTHLDLQPGIPPPPLYRVPWLMVGGVTGALLLFAYLGAWTVQRRAERMRVAEVMRLAG